ncbi:MAG: histidinol-phosphate aminotransferase family protein [Erysipelotrichales bacterium]|nr:histidinol-phosphate aminotransferase family protein [Erysipelotrichales bacterium]
MSYRLHLNENNLLKHKSLKHNLESSLNKSHQYSGKLCDKTANLIAKYYNICRENIAVFNGLDEAIFFTTLYCSLFLKGTIVTTEKTYDTINECCIALNNNIVQFGLSDNRINIKSLCIDIEKHIQNNGSISLCYICNPHNPTGSIMNGSINKLLKLAKKNNFLVFVDEAYIEYIDEKKYKLEERLLNENIIIGRTFSKAFGLAGLRCGYIITKNRQFLRWIAQINNALLYKENIVNVSAIKTVLFEENLLEITRKNTVMNRKLLEKILVKHRIDFLKSHTNFILIHPPYPIANFICYAREKFDILLFDASYFGWDGYVRITIGTKEAINQIEKFLIQIEKENYKV